MNSVLARRILGCVYREGQVYRIPFGPLRGVKLRYRPAINFHAMLGMWELPNFRVLEQLRTSPGCLAPNAAVCDVGGNIGLVSLWLARTAVPAGRVHTFEAAPDTAAMLQDHLTLNATTNVELKQMACADHSGEVEFFIGFHHHVSSLLSDWAGGQKETARRVVVPATTLDEFYYGATNRPPPALIKMDIEGGAVYALKGCNRCLAEARPWVLIESHNPAEDGAISTVLTRHRYRAYRVNTHRWVTAPAETHPNPEGVWGTMLLCPEERAAQLQGFNGAK